jgi:hypothetical protein
VHVVALVGLEEVEVADIAAREIGSETVTYVSNIYKYYIGYKMVEQINAEKKKKG